jgi:Trk K+ transport system NAD-binding subunit
MRILVVGAGRVGAGVVLQLRKNPNIEVLTVDPREDPYAVQQKIIADVDFREPLTPNVLEYVIKQTKPDLVLVTTATEDMDLGKAPGIDILAEALREELAAISDVPVVAVARAALR